MAYQNCYYHFKLFFETSKQINFLGRPLAYLSKNLEQYDFDNEKKYKKKIIDLNKNILKSLSEDKVNILLIEGITDPIYSINNNVNFIERLKLLKDTLKKKVKIKIIFVMRNHPDFIFQGLLKAPNHLKIMIKNGKTSRN